MDNVEENKLESICVVLVTEQCWSGTSTLLSNQKHKNEFKSILHNKFHFGRTQLLIVRRTLGTSEKGLLHSAVLSSIKHPQGLFLPVW